MLEFPEEVLQFKVRGKQYECNKPTNADIKKYRVELSKCKTDDEKENALRVFLSDLGLDVEVLDMLTPTQTEQFITSLYTAEKN